MIKLSNFLNVILIILILVQSNSPFEWQPLNCKTEGKLEELKLQALVFHIDKLYFYYPEFVIRIQQLNLNVDFQSRKPDPENVIMIYGEAEYANYSDMESRPNFMDQPTFVFYHVLWETKWLTYSFRKDNKIYEVMYEEGEFAG